MKRAPLGRLQGGLLGVRFALSGYRPGPGLACAATGRLDALVSVLGVLLGALVLGWTRPRAWRPYLARSEATGFLRLAAAAGR